MIQSCPLVRPQQQTTNIQKVRFGQGRNACECCGPKLEKDEMDKNFPSKDELHPLGDEMYDQEDEPNDAAEILPPPSVPENPQILDGVGPTLG